MASFKCEGMEEFIETCIFTEKNIDKIVGRSIYPGAELMGTAIKAATAGIPVNDRLFMFAYHFRRAKKGITSRQKKALIESMGIAEIKKNKYGLNVKIGWDGYNDIVSPRWPKGQPNAMIARSLNSGTSFLQKYPFVDVTVRAYANPTVKAISDQFDKELDKIWNK